MVSVPKLVTPRRLVLVLLVVYLLYMVAMYLKDLKEEEKEQVKVEAVVNRVAVNTTDSGKDASVVLLLNDERVSKVDVKEGKEGEEKGGGGEDKGGRGEDKGRGGGDKNGGGEEKGGGGEGKKGVRVGGEVSAEMNPTKNDSWLKNKTEVRLWIGEVCQL